MRALTILNVTPLSFPVPARGYGGIQRVACWLTRGLVKLGHKVILAGPRGSGGEGLPIVEIDEAPRLKPWRWHYRRYFRQLRDRVKHERIDVVLTHGAWVEHLMPFFPDVPVLRTVHGNKEPLPPVTSINFISHAQRITYGRPNAEVIYNPIEPGDFVFSEEKDDYILFMARLDWPVKGLDVALRVTQAANVQLKLAGPGRKFHRKIRGLDHVEYVGEVGGERKAKLLSRARALLYPTQWPEPFGLAPAEANMCGTPAVVTHHGAMPEVVNHGVTGFVCRTEAELVAALADCRALEPRACRAWALERFGIDKIAKDYEAYFERVLAGVTLDAAPDLR